MTHILKCWPAYFDAVARGDKPFEVRRNDRDYQVGDALVLEEWIPETGEYTRRAVTAVVSFVLSGEEWGVVAGYCVLGLTGIKR